ncbi:fluoride efflux transporter CrcB [Halioxenophilus aromaticivorans]|uniref:Fluoride-specific ion channel FluC n=1 Tax=Halioxenophilus aromaticivorans TaxID=1306992 RepID=A0AAV3UAC2_9ALTE
MGAWLAVAIGGALGAMTRFGISTYWLPVVPGRIPWSTLLVNVVGSLLIGILYVIIVDKGLWSQQWRVLLMTGFMGALTTFSTFSIESVSLLQRQQFGLAGVYVVVSVVACILASFLAIWLTHKILSMY